MIKLFRNIRKKLVEQGKTANYLKYAIGEILLVVIGILIALQINNWNEKRKNQLFEREILTLIDQNLERDATLLTIELNKTKKAIVLTEKLLAQVSQKKYTDSLNFWMGHIISFERFKSQTSAFEVLKAKGIETISNKKLQLNLITYYEENLFKVYQSLNDVELFFNQDWTPVLKENFNDFKWLDYTKPINTEAFFSKPSSIMMFKLYKDNRQAGLAYKEDALEKIAEIRHQIKTFNQ